MSWYSDQTLAFINPFDYWTILSFFGVFLDLIVLQALVKPYLESWWTTSVIYSNEEQSSLVAWSVTRGGH